MSGPGPDGPEWTDSAADHHRGLTVLTAAVRGEVDRAVRTVNATLGMTGKQPCNAGPPPALPQEMPDSLRQRSGSPAAVAPGCDFRR